MPDAQTQSRTNVISQGWTIFDKLYLLNGTLYVVSNEPSKIPDRTLMISTGVPVENGPVEEARRVPTDNEMQIITPKNAKRLFGSDAELIDGVSVSFSIHLAVLHQSDLRVRQWLPNDPRQLYVLTNIL